MGSDAASFAWMSVFMNLMGLESAGRVPWCPCAILRVQLGLACLCTLTEGKAAHICLAMLVPVRGAQKHTVNEAMTLRLGRNRAPKRAKSRLRLSAAVVPVSPMLRDA